jgi:ATP-dependent DNA helicase RecG
MLPTTPISALRGIGPQSTRALAEMGISTVWDVLLLLPKRYRDDTQLTPIADVEPDKFVVVEGMVSQLKKNRSGPSKSHARLTLTDERSGDTIAVQFFQLHNSVFETLTVDARVRCAGKASGKPLALQHPEWQLITPGEQYPLPTTLTTFYTLPDRVHQKAWRRHVQAIWDALHETNALLDPIPDNIRKDFNFPTLKEALAMLHFPPAAMASDIDALNQFQHPAQQRFIFEELFLYQAQVLKSAHKLQNKSAFGFSEQSQSLEQFYASLPFEPTMAQHKVIAEILNDCSQTKAMLRLLQGDVGAGKTLVAAAVAIVAMANGYQVAMMAPTEILAEQHAKSFTEWLTPFGFKIQVLLGKHTAAEKFHAKKAIESGAVQCIIGTQALFQSGVAYHQLGLVIIDEQHRFGAKQRLALWQKGQDQNAMPHQLIMTATPIPRTLALTQYANFGVSVIDALPPGRQPVTTVAIGHHKRHAVIERIQTACEKGQQVYWVCPLIEESDKLSAVAVSQAFNELTSQLPNCRVAQIHGRVDDEVKAATMRAFAAGEIDILVATTVIEVGVNVPNATLMILDNAERLGLAQAHQLRGRVGRGEQQSYCVLLYKAPLSDVARERLDFLRQTSDGFAIAEKDWALRGAGDLLGTAQSGFGQWRFANLARDAHWLPKVAEAAQSL